jgi:hypothetical protein
MYPLIPQYCYIFIFTSRLIICQYKFLLSQYLISSISSNADSYTLYHVQLSAHSPGIAKTMRVACCICSLSAQKKPLSRRLVSNYALLVQKARCRPCLHAPAVPEASGILCYLLLCRQLSLMTRGGSKHRALHHLHSSDRDSKSQQHRFLLPSLRRFLFLSVCTI